MSIALIANISNEPGNYFKCNNTYSLFVHFKHTFFQHIIEIYLYHILLYLANVAKELGFLIRCGTLEFKVRGPFVQTFCIEKDSYI